MTHIHVVIEPNGTWHEYELDWWRADRRGATASRPWEEGLRRLVDQYSDHLGLVFWIRL